MMDSCRATWYDGRTSKAHPVTVSLNGEELCICGEGIDQRYPLAAVCVDTGLGRLRRLLRFPDGATAETAAQAFVDGLLQRQGKGRVLGRVHRWEMSLRAVLVALVVTVLVVVAFVRYGVPALAKRVAFALPARTEELIGRETLQILDRIGMERSRLPEPRRQEIARIFAAMNQGRPERSRWRLEFRDAKAVGANAFALPSGIVIVTDKMVEVAGSDDGIAGVLAHEVGHLTGRHALRHLLQNSATVLVVAGLTGDITSISSFAATMPTALIDAKYSRDFEREADQAAVAYLKGRGIPVRVYAEVLARLDADHYRERAGTPRLGELFDNHPQMRERVQAVVDSEKQGLGARD